MLVRFDSLLNLLTEHWREVCFTDETVIPIPRASLAG